MVREINIDEVLLRIQERAAEGKTFALEFVRATGDRKGSIKKVLKARYGAADREKLASDKIPLTPKGGTVATPLLGAGVQRKVSLHVDAGTLPLTDRENNRYFTPIIRLIVGFDGMVVIH